MVEETHCCVCEYCLCFGMGYIESRCILHINGDLRKLQRKEHPYLFVFKVAKLSNRETYRSSGIDGTQQVEVIISGADPKATIINGRMQMPIGVWEAVKKGLVSYEGFKFVVKEEE